jgi:hypothetical protein
MALLGLIAIIGPYSEAQNNDVYNFYFQKGPAPQQVIQSGGGQAAAQPPAAPQPIPTQVQPAVDPPASNVVMAKTQPEPEKPLHDFKRIDLMFGGSRLSDELGTGLAYTFGAQYNFLRYLGVRAQGEFLDTSTAKYNVRPVDENDGSTKYGGQAALVFTPLHLELLGHQMLKVSALAGVTSRRFCDDPNLDPDHYTSCSSVKRGLRPFYGASASFALNENVAIEGNLAMMDGGRIGKASANLVVSF